MATQSFNPYPLLITDFVKVLDKIGPLQNTIVSVDDLVNVIYPAIQQVYYPNATTITEVELRAIMVQIIFYYQNDPYSNIVDVIDDDFLETIIQLKTLVPVKSMAAALNDLQSQILSGSQSFEEREPQLLALLFGVEIEKYWSKQISTSIPWTSFKSQDVAINLAEMSFWVDACVIGSLLGYSLALSGAISPTTDVRSTSLIASLIGALAVGSGKVIFRWIPEQDITFGGGTMSALFGTRTGAGTYSTVNQNNGQVQNTPYASDKTYRNRPTRYFF